VFAVVVAPAAIDGARPVQQPGGQVTPVQPQQRPTFRSGVSLVPVDVRVVDRMGKPITDLTEQEFSVLEDGAPQTIRHFSKHEFTAEAAFAAGAPEFRTAETPDLAPQNRRVFLLVLGRGRHQSVSKYVDGLVSFVRSRILPQDHVAVLAWNRATDFTTNHALVADVLTRYRDAHEAIEMDLSMWFSGLRAIYGSTEIPSHIQKQIDVVFSTAEELRPRPPAPAPIVDADRIRADVRETARDLASGVLSRDRLTRGFSNLGEFSVTSAHLSGWDFDDYIARMTETLQDTGNLYAGVAYLRLLAGEKHLVFVTANGVSLPSQDDNRSLARVAADARIALDFVQTGGVVGAPPVQITAGRVSMEPVATSNQVFAQGFNMQDLRLMADRTGGQLMAYRTADDAFRRLERSMQSQYLLGYTSTNAAIDGTFRKVTVKVSRPGAMVIAREGYMALEQPEAMDRRELVTFSRIRNAAAYPSIVDHLGVRLDKASGTATDVSVNVLVDITRVQLEQRDGIHAADLEVAMYAGNAKDLPIGDTRRRIELRLTPEEYAKALKEGVTFTMTSKVRETARVVKVVVYDYGADLVGTAVTRVPRK
jgi:VWFA-related protein